MFIITHMAESMSGDYPDLKADTAFFSAVILCVATALNRSPEQLVTELPLSEELMRVFSAQGDDAGGRYQALVTCASRFSRQACDQCSSCMMPPQRVQWHYEKALNWSDQLIQLMKSDSTPIKACV